MFQYVYTCESCGLKETVEVKGRMNLYRTIKEKGWEVKKNDNDRLECPTCKLTLGSILRDYLKYQYVKDGKPYRKLDRDEVIGEDAMQSWCNGELQPVMGTDTIGDTPSSFSDERDFYNPI